MKPQTWIWGPLALAAGLIPPTTPTASAQNNTVTNNAPAKASAAKPAPAKPAAANATPAKPGAANATPAKPSAAKPTPSASASSAQTLPSILVWNTQATSASRVGAWGNGKAEVTRGRTGTSLVVTTHNLEEGARFDLSKPLDLTPYRQTGFWQLKFQSNSTSQRRGRGGRTRNQRGTTTQGTPPPLTQLRLKLVLDQGVMSGFIPIRQSSRRTRGSQWQNLLIPVRSFSSSPGARGPVRRIVLTGDSEASFNLDQISLVAETTRITASLRRETDPPGTTIKTITVKPGRSTTLVADVNGGTSDLNISWNFNADNSVAFPPPNTGRGSTRGGAPTGGRPAVGGRPPMGGQPAVAGRAPVGGRPTAGTGVPTLGNTMMMRRRVDATGLSARPNWPNEEQDYRVEVTISDRAGKKPTVKESMLVQVRGGI